ncbi:MAG: nucleotidyltransferase domain-containing protein [Methanobrevibacter sp.]|jgi:predicted nucleotidyltransferase|nr:nucleotidyltransferase domain-containing protein [Candidatus Methanovirga basalitermitum]
MDTVSDSTTKKEVIDRKQIAIDFANSLNHPEIERIVLFGSVARGDDDEESDIDILIITKKENDDLKIRKDIYNRVFNILMSIGERISIKMRHLNQYNSHIDFPFYMDIEKDGIVLKS